MVKWIVALTTACLSVTAVAQRKIESNGFRYAVQNVPAWVQASPAQPAHPWTGTSSMRYLLVDSQINLAGQSPQTFTRSQVTARDQAALADIANIRIDFNPAYESLTLHEVGVTRSGVRRNKLIGAKFQLLQRETQLDRNIYGGLVTALLIVDDVRLNDVIDVSYTVTGANPIFKGKYAAVFALNTTVPADVRRVRIEYPSERTLAHKVVGIDEKVTTASKGKNSVLELVVSSRPPITPEDRVTQWAQVYPELQVSEYPNWAAVEAWATEHYQVPRQLSPELFKLAETIRSESATPEEMAASVLRFVQAEIRYFAIATGISSYKPSPPDVTFARRYGDCKDKTLLTIALLQQLGIEARPALVSLSRQRQVSQWLAMPHAFDHVITQATINGQTYWLDATRLHQGSELSRQSFEPFGNALLVGGEKGDLVSVVAPSGYNQAYEVSERFSIKRYTGPIELTITTRVSSGYADRLRYYLASKGKDVVIQEFADSVKQRYPSAKRVKDANVSDELKRNEITVTEYYEVGDLFKYASGSVTSSVYPISFAGVVRLPDKTVRSTPMQLPFATTMKHQFEFELPLDLASGASQPVNVSAPQFAFSYRSTVERRRFAMQYEMRFIRDHVLPTEMATYVETLSQVRRQFDRQLRFPLFDAEVLQREYVASANSQQRTLASQPEWMRRHLMRALSRRMAAEAAIRSGQLEGRPLAEAWLEIAVERSNSSERDKALEAVDMALKADADSSRAYKTRAEIFAYGGKFNDALPEMKRALSLDRDGGLFSLGQIQYYLGQYADAVNSFAADAQRTSGPEQMHRLMWLYLAAKKANMDALETMRQNGYVEQSDWPGPIGSYLAGTTSEEALLAAARAASSPADAAPRLCEAWFFIAQNKLLRGDSERAQRAFQDAIDTKIEPYIEYRYSRIELERIRK